MDTRQHPPISTPRGLAPLLPHRSGPPATTNAYECYADLNATLATARAAVDQARAALEEAVEVNKFLRALLHPGDQKMHALLRRDSDQIQAQLKGHERARLALMALPEIGEPVDDGMPVHRVPRTRRERHATCG